ncbi:MAG: RNA polymerase sigma factor [Myxococcaceae bacterium]
MTESAARSKPGPEMTPVAAVPSDHQAMFSAIYRRELPYVWKSISRLGARDRDREDLAHDIFATAYRQWHKYDPARPVRPWLFGISYRVVLDYKRKHSYHREDVVEAIEVQDEARTAEDKLAAAQGWDLAMRALDALELDRRAVFVMHEIDGHPIPEVAAAIGIPLNTAYSRLRLARRDFNLEVAALQGGGGR